MRVLFPGQINTAVTNAVSQNNKNDNSMNFSDILKGAISEVDTMQKAADASAMALALGDVDNLHQVMIDAEKAEIALQFTLQIRNKIIDAYQEIMRMQV